jgi:hypothetical protein
VGLQSRLNLAETLLLLSRLDQAHRLSSETAGLAKQMNDPEVTIDAHGTARQNRSDRGDFPGVRRLSDGFIQEMQAVIVRFKNEQRLILSSKIYEYLKQAVLYEIRNHRPENAFLKLDYAKTLWWSKS